MIKFIVRDDITRRIYYKFQNHVDDFYHNNDLSYAECFNVKLKKYNGKCEVGYMLFETEEGLTLFMMEWA